MSAAGACARRTTIGLAQIGEVTWERRPGRQYQVVAGTLRGRPMAASSKAASLAYLPHVAGLLQASVQRHAPDAADIDFLVPLYKRISVAEAAAHLAEADVVGLSVYVWNIRLSLAIAREVKRRKPQALVVLGGPQVPDRAEAFLHANPFVDVVCHGEGERTFVDILAHRHARDFEAVASTSHLDAQGCFRTRARRPRVVDLDEVASPMLDGTYDALMRSQPSQHWLATWETNRGCPFSCTFCDWGSATGSKVSRYGMERLRAEVDWLADHGIDHLFVCDANFGMLARDLELAEYIADTYTARRRHVAISVQNTKNRTDRSEQIQRIFQRSGVVSFGASISLQTTDPGVLKAIRRDNVSSEAFARLQKHYAREGLDTYTDLIIGLPGETCETFMHGVAEVIAGGQINRVAFYECSVLPNAPMADPDYRAAFAIETVPVRIVHAHEPMRDTADAMPEAINIVVSTSALPREDWVRARVFAHLVELLYFDRVLHVPLTVLASVLDLRQVFDSFLCAPAAEFPISAWLRGRFEAHARDLQQGGPQYMDGSEWLGIWWPVDQYALIELAAGGHLEALYAESGVLITRCARARWPDIDAVLVDELMVLNQSMFALPFQWEDVHGHTTYPVGAAYLAASAGRQPDLAPAPEHQCIERTHTVWMTWNDWCEDLVRRVFLRRNYLYPMTAEAWREPDAESEPAAVTAGAASMAARRDRLEATHVTASAAGLAAAHARSAE